MSRLDTAEYNGEICFISQVITKKGNAFVLKRKRLFILSGVFVNSQPIVFDFRLLYGLNGQCVKLLKFLQNSVLRANNRSAEGA